MRDKMTQCLGPANVINRASISEMKQFGENKVIIWPLVAESGLEVN